MSCLRRAARPISFERYARILPLSVISELLGLPMADRPRFIAWANAMSSLTNVVSFFRLLLAFRKMRVYLAQQLQIARVQGGEGLIAELVQVEREGGADHAGRNGVDGVPAARGRLGDHHASHQRLGLRTAQKSGIA